MKITFQKLITTAVLVAAVLLAPLLVTASITFQGTLDDPYTSFSTGSTNAGTLPWAIISARSVNSGTPRITQINANSDKAGSKVQFYRIRGLTGTTDTNTTVTIPVSTTNNVYAASGVIVIRHVANDHYEKRILTTSTGATNLVVTVAPDQTVVVGDLVYSATTDDAGYILTQTNTAAAGGFLLSTTGANLVSGQKGKPLLLELDATTTGNINSVTATYDP